MNSTTPLERLTLPELKRSALLQVVEMRAFVDQLESIGRDTLLHEDQGRVDRLCWKLQVLSDNLDRTMDRISDLQAEAA